MTATGKIGFNDSLYRQDVKTQFAQESSATHSQGRQEMEGKIFTYTSAWSHAYSCLRGGTGQFKSPCLGKKNRSSLGTGRLGCKANLQVWLLNVSNGVQVLEIQIPMMSARLPAHNPSSVTDQLTMKPLWRHQSEAIAQERNSLFDQEAVLQLLKEEQARNGLKYYRIAGKFGGNYIWRNTHARVWIVVSADTACG